MFFSITAFPRLIGYLDFLQIFLSILKIINMYILRKEYKKVGYTSAYLRAFWIIDLFFQSIFLYLIVYELETPINQCMDSYHSHMLIS